MISMLLLSLLISSPTYKVQRSSYTYEKKQINQIVRYLKNQSPRVLRGVMRAMKWSTAAKSRPCKKTKTPSAYDKWEERMLLDLMMP